FSDWLQFFRRMGPRYFLFRLWFEIKRRTGMLRSQFPTDPLYKEWITLADWRTHALPFFFGSRKDIVPGGENPVELRKQALRIFNGEINFFHAEWKKLELNDWLTNPDTGYKYDNQKHWTEIPDFDPAYGDIKYTWEKSRFGFVQTILRYDAHFNKDSSAWVFDQIESWIDHNPINRGPNYRCSQETSLRLFNWIVALYFYKNSDALTEERFKKIIFHLYWQIKHVRANIQFSRIAVRNNHAITETLLLYTAGLLFPFFEEAEEWKSSGKKWFEEEIAYQIFEDGGYVQFSFNYQRVVIQLLTWAIALSEKHKERWSAVVYERAHASLNLLVNCQDPISGMLPNYGSNDGSLFFNWNDASFRDFRPALDTLHLLLSGKPLYNHGYEDSVWYGINGEHMNLKPLTLNNGTQSFPKAGIFTYRKNNLLIFINCVTYKVRPLQADNLHLDLWYKGDNLLVDGGSYRYNTDPDTTRYFMGTESHNTIMLGPHDQMRKGPRFIWLNWTKAIQARWKEEEHKVVFEGAIRAFDSLGKIVHHRKVEIKEQVNKLIVTDRMEGKYEESMRQLWHVLPRHNDRIKIETQTEGASKLLREKKYAATYGVVEPCLQIEVSKKSNLITTEISWA
ncbi:MAG: alginate lyase family protein, partial [Cyclobacteriaceae bacterium]|nr:alginate lyase family protein [Cyclobacteriaceae bacterium]